MIQKNYSLRGEVKKRLAELNMSQHQLADELGMSDAYLTDILYERKTGDKPQEHIVRMFIILGMDEIQLPVAQAQ